MKLYLVQILEHIYIKNIKINTIVFMMLMKRLWKII